MSTILKALRRLEEEQKSQRELEEQGPREELLAASGAARRSSILSLMKGLLALSVTAALGAAVTLGLLPYFDEPNTPSGGAPPDANVRAAELAATNAGAGRAGAEASKDTALPFEIESAAAEGSAPAAPKPAPDRRLATAPKTRAVTAVQEEPEFLPEEPESLRESTSGSVVALRPDSERAVPELMMVERRVQTLPEVSSDLPEETVSEPTRQAPRSVGDELVVARVSPPSIPTVVRSQVPDVLVKRTVWHPDGTRREAVVEVLGGEVPRTVRMREGESLGALQLAEIRPSSVTFIHDGVELMRRVGARP
jgi:hypothetical protein